MKKKEKYKDKSGLVLLIIWLSCFIVPFIYKLFGHEFRSKVTSFAINEKFILIDHPGVMFAILLLIISGTVVVSKIMEKK